MKLHYGYNTMQLMAFLSQTCTYYRVTLHSIC